MAARRRGGGPAGCLGQRAGVAAERRDGGGAEDAQDGEVDQTGRIDDVADAGVPGMAGGSAGRCAIEALLSAGLLGSRGRRLARLRLGAMGGEIGRRIRRLGAGGRRRQRQRRREDQARRRLSRGCGAW